MSRPKNYIKEFASKARWIYVLFTDHDPLNGNKKKYIFRITLTYPKWENGARVVKFKIILLINKKFCYEKIHKQNTSMMESINY